MDPFAVSHFSDDALLHDLKARVLRECTSTAVLLTRIAEVDERKLYLREAYPSMYAYCVHELHFSEGAAYKRINAGRAARRFPVIFVALAEGRVHLSGVVTLAPYLTSGNVDELLADATHKTRAEIEQLIAHRFPRPDLPERLQAIPSPSPSLAMAPAHMVQLSPGKVDADTPLTGQPAPGPGHQLSPGNVQAPAPPSKVTPLAPERFGLQVTLDQETYDLLQYARALMSHQVARGEIVPVLKSALKCFVGHLEKRKFAATSRPRPSRSSADPRHIPAHVERAVCERDGGQCTFVGENGKRCSERSMLEFDHIDPVARGGEATVQNLRLVCRAHNQYEAEVIFGAGFMSQKREEAQRARARAAATELGAAT